MAELGYTLTGDAGDPAVLFLHGFMGSAEDWQDVIAKLEERRRCLSVDLPGHGESVGLFREAYTTEGAVRTLLDLLDELDFGPPTIVGYSMGGRLALYLALHHPARCAGLFLESASPGIESAAARWARREADEERARHLEEDFGRFLQDWYRRPRFGSLGRHEGVVGAMIDARARNGPGGVAGSLRGTGVGRGPSLWRELTELGVPALAVAGALDEKFVEISHRMADLNPRLRTVIVQGAGHNVHLESPEAYLSLLQDFLEIL